MNKTDAMTLITTFGTLANIIRATEKRLTECPGFGVTKARKLYKALHEPFLKRGAAPQSKDDFAGNLSIEDIESIETTESGSGATKIMDAQNTEVCKVEVESQ